MKDSFDARVFSYLSRHEFLNWVGDETFIKLRYLIVKHKHLDLNNPKTFNEKIQWLKLYYHCPEYISIVDKCEVKEIVSHILGEQYIIPTIGGPWNSFDEINWENLPNRFLLKCTHNSGTGVIFVNDKKKLNIVETKKKMEINLRQNFFYAEREWPYKYVRPRIFAEQYIEDKEAGQLMDYKIHVFSGCAKIIQVDFDRFTGHKRNLYNTDWEYIPATIEYPTHPEIMIKRPKKLNEMINIAERLGRNLPYVRVDLYYANNKIYFGEMTFYHGGGLENIYPIQFEEKMGSWIMLPRKKL